MSPRSSPSLKRRVLVVDDDPDIREALVFALELEGYAVRGAANGAGALRILGEWPAHLIVLDLMMPEMDGRAFLTERERVAGFDDIPILIISALRDLAAHARGLRAVAIYEKPLAMDEFLEAVRTLTRRRDDL